MGFLQRFDERNQRAAERVNAQVHEHDPWTSGEQSLPHGIGEKLVVGQQTLRVIAIVGVTVVLVIVGIVKGLSALPW